MTIATEKPFSESVADKPSAGPSQRGWHRLSDNLRCEQKFAYRHLLKLLPHREPEGRALGALVHLGLMHHYLARLGMPDARDLLSPIEAMRQAPARIAYTFERARRIYEAYREYRAEEARELLDVEREFRVTVGGFLHTQRFDLVEARFSKLLGRKAAYITDHKTAGDTSHVSREWSIAGQFIAGSLVAEATFPDVYGLPFGGVIINSIGTQYPFEPSEHEITIREPLKLPILRTIEETNARIAKCAAENRDPWQYTRSYACRDRYGDCEYLALCQRGQSAIGEYVVAEDQATEAERS